MLVWGPVVYFALVAYLWDLQQRKSMLGVNVKYGMVQAGEKVLTRVFGLKCFTSNPSLSLCSRFSYKLLAIYIPFKIILKFFNKSKKPLFHHLDFRDGAMKTQRWEEFHTGNNTHELQTDKYFCTFRSWIRCKRPFLLLLTTITQTLSGLLFNIISEFTNCKSSCSIFGSENKTENDPFNLQTTLRQKHFTISLFGGETCQNTNTSLAEAWLCCSLTLHTSPPDQHMQREVSQQNPSLKYSPDTGKVQVQIHIQVLYLRFISKPNIRILLTSSKE